VARTDTHATSLRSPRYFGAVTGGVIILYFVFTLTTTDWRDKYRRIMNEKDNESVQRQGMRAQRHP
jgi:ABC-type transport system involved in Fe-S cluster assembly fused permease/ATPase subunit